MDCHSSNQENLSKYHKLYICHTPALSNSFERCSYWKSAECLDKAVTYACGARRIWGLQSVSSPWICTSISYSKCTWRCWTQGGDWVWSDELDCAGMEGGWKQRESNIEDPWLKLLHLLKEKHPTVDVDDNCTMWCWTCSRWPSMEKLEVCLMLDVHCALQSGWIALCKFILFWCIRKRWTLVNETSSHCAAG